MEHVEQATAAPGEKRVTAADIVKVHRLEECFAYNMIEDAGVVCCLHCGRRWVIPAQ